MLTCRCALRLAPLQTVLAVAVGEESCEFEHRDLHWGNLLIRRSEEAAQGAAVRARLRGVELEAPTEGVTVRRGGAGRGAGGCGWRGCRQGCC